MQPDQNKTIPPQIPQPDVIPEMYIPIADTETTAVPVVTNTAQPAPISVSVQPTVSVIPIATPIQPIQPIINVEPVNIPIQPIQPVQAVTDDELASAPSQPVQIVTNDELVGDESDEPIQSVSDDEPVYWSANEYIHQEKNGLWFVIFGIVVISFIAADIFLIHSFFYTFSILVIVMAAAVIIYSRRPPRMIDYTLSGDQGLYIGERLYHFSEFKAFGLIRDQGEHSIMLIPVKRFSPGVTVYFPEEAGEKIVDIFGARLPMQDLKLDLVDVIVRKLRL